MFLIKISWDGFERLGNYEAVHTVCVCSTEEEASSAKNTGEEEEEEETLKGPAETEERKHTNMMIIQDLVTLYNDFHQNALKIYI